jgi:hypothetical protein
MFITAFFMACISSYLAHKRGRNPYAWFAISFLFVMFGIFVVFFAAHKKKKTALPEQTEVPILHIDGPTDKFWYYLDPSHTQKGPISKDALTTALKEGQVDLSTYVWHEEMTDWKLLKDTLKAEF